MKGFWDVIRFAQQVRIVAKSAQDTPGLVRFKVLIESPRVYLILSIWDSEENMARWAGSVAHVHAVHISYGICGEVWSAHWNIAKLSPSARSWRR